MKNTDNSTKQETQQSLNEEIVISEENNSDNNTTDNTNLKNYVEIDMPILVGMINTDVIFSFDLRGYIAEQLVEQDIEGTTFNINIIKYLSDRSVDIQGNYTIYGTGRVTRQTPSENSKIKIFYDGDGNVSLGEDIKVFCDDATENSTTMELTINKAY